MEHLKRITDKIHHGYVPSGNGKVVFTNGCFDLLHFGHISYLAEARSLGDYLIVGLNDDNSVKRLKGINRPINDMKSRAYQIASLEFVSEVIIFSEDTPINLIREIRPDVLVKGGGYMKEQVVGWEVVESYGGEVKVLGLEEGYSTSLLEDKILNQPPSQ